MLLETVDEIGTEIYKCDYCGTVIEYYPLQDEEDKKEYEYWTEEEHDDTSVSHGYDVRCPKCNHYVVWGNDFMRSDFEYDENHKTDENGCVIDDALVRECHCPHCGGGVTIYDTKPSEFIVSQAFKESEKWNTMIKNIKSFDDIKPIVSEIVGETNKTEFENAIEEITNYINKQLKK